MSSIRRSCSSMGASISLPFSTRNVWYAAGMDIDWVRQYCLSLPHTTEKVQWQDDLVFKIGGKMYAVVALEPGDHWLSFKSTPEEFADLVERHGVIPAPYLARAHWV